MALFQQCTAATATLAAQIADSAGASADTEMLARAGVAWGNAVRYFSNYADWDFARMEAPTTLITAPFSPMITGTTIAGRATGGGNTIDFYVGNVTGFGILPNDFILGPMFASNDAGRVTATATAQGAANTVTATVSFANNFNTSLWSTAGATAFITANRDEYDLPTDFKQPYSVRLLGGQVTLRYVGRRLYDRSVSSEYTASQPFYYDTFTFGQYSKIRLLRSPQATDRLQIRYYRKLNATSANADIPEQYEPYLTSYGKYLFLLDKADSMERANAWKAFAMEGLQVMLKENINNPDADITMQPGAYAYDLNNSPNSTRQIRWDE